MSSPDFESWSTGRLLSTAARHVERAWTAWLAERDLTHAGLLVLHALEVGPQSQRELAEASQVEEQTMTRVLARLQRTGHITRERDLADRRRVVVQRTSLGTQAFGEVRDSPQPDVLVTAALVDPTAFRADLVRLVTSAGEQDDAIR